MFGTESLCGDWNGDLLIVAEHFAPDHVIDDRLAAGKADPYSHDPTFFTNQRIAELLTKNNRIARIDGSSNTTCGALYISACFFLRVGVGASTRLPRGWKKGSHQVFDFVLSYMPNLKKIACLGQLSFNFVLDRYSLSTDWKTTRDSRNAIKINDNNLGRNFSIYAHSHPGVLGTNMRLPKASKEDRIAAINEDWRVMLQLKSVSTARATSILRRPAVKTATVADAITLDHEARGRRRLAMTADGGLDFLLDLPRPANLNDGDALQLEDGRLVLVRAAEEELVEVTAATPLRLAKIAWHLGNRHTPAEVTDEAIYVAPDHVLVEMVRGLGGATRVVRRPFQPETGAYSGHDHAHE
ncbi:urease accessory protein UreE [Hansschlegelia plantiphila]|nr:urease accessory protein UreE [Hansschlegelia plantiphila]